MASLPLREVPAKSSTEICRVCNCDVAEKHFGAISCKACAAFFRRFVNSTNAQKFCTCGMSKIKSILNMCRFCRMQKCLTAGMNKCGVQLPKNCDTVILVTIQSRGFEKILQLKEVYDSAKSERQCFITSMRTPERTTFRKITSGWKNDSDTMWKICVTSFPEIADLSHVEMNMLLCNFYPKWVGFSAAFELINSGANACSYSPPSINAFYERDTSCLLKSQTSLESIFTPFWKFYSSNVLNPIIAADLDGIEIIAILALLLMDSGYSNHTKKSHKHCQNFAKIVKLQLASYYEEVGKPIDRLFEIMDVLLIIERLEEKMLEKVQLCIAYGIAIDKDCLKILNISKL